MTDYLNKIMLTNGNSLPFDVFFRLTEEGKTLGAHKWPLVAASDVFRVQFTGAMSQKREHDCSSCVVAAELVEVEDCTLKTFKTMLQLINTGERQIIMGCTNLLELFRLFKVLDKYQIKAWVEVVRERINTIDITLYNLFEALGVAVLFKDLFIFDHICQKLIGRCAISAFREGRIAFYKVVTENHHKPDLIRFLFKELSQLPINPTCANCLNEISKCKHGQLLSSYPGEGVMISLNGDVGRSTWSADSYWSIISDQTKAVSFSSSNAVKYHC